MKRTISILVALLWAAVSAGCASHQQSPATSSSAHASAAGEFANEKEPPVNANTHFAAGQLAESQGHTADAIAQYNEALRNDPKHLNSIYRLGVLYAQLKQYGQAVDMWERYVTATHGSAEAYSNLGFCQELAGQPAAAELAYKTGIAHDPRSEPCRVNYGLMLARHNHPNEAMLQLQAVLTPAQAHYDLASVYQQQNRLADARAEYQKALTLDPKLTDAQSKLASLSN